MTAVRPLTAAERELLAAIRELLDIPQAAEYDDLKGRSDTLCSRVSQLVGCLDVAGDCTHSSTIATVRSIAGTPLKYTPETPEQAAEREAAFRAKYPQLFSAEQPSLAEILPGALAEIEAIGRNPGQPA
jgi:hypothetical protein